MALVLRLMLACALAIGFSVGPALADGKPLQVFAAASLKNALDEAAADFGEGGTKVVGTYAASSALAKQIESGAPADIYVSADTAWMDELTQKALVRPDSVVKLLGNEIVLVAPVGTAKATEIMAGLDLKALLAGGKLAMADTKAVPAGKYGKAALDSLGLWTGVEADVVQAENVRAALKLVAVGEAALGIVYASDAKDEPAVQVVGTFPASSHPPVIYPAGIVATSSHEQAQAFLDYLKGAAAAEIFARHGFKPLTR